MTSASPSPMPPTISPQKAQRFPPLHGLPIAFKDLQPAVGFRFTRGSPIFKDDMPQQDSVLVGRLRNAGAIAIGKTNVPEFGMDSHTYNNVYGTTFNPYDLSKSAGGSSGGAGAALATGMLPIADGSDLGGSLRNPGNFNNVVGFRPTVGLVPSGPNPYPLLGFAVNGPMGRTVADTAFLLSVMAGPDPRDPGCYPSDPSVFRGGVSWDFAAQFSRHAHRLVPGLGRPAARPPRARRAGRAAQNVRGSGMRCRGGVSRSERCGFDLSDDPRLSLRGSARAAARRAPRSDEAGSHWRNRGRTCSAKRHGRAGDDPPRRVARPHAPLSGAVPVHPLRRESGPALRRQAPLAREHQTALRA